MDLSGLFPLLGVSSEASSLVDTSCPVCRLPYRFSYTFSGASCPNPMCLDTQVSLASSWVSWCREHLDVDVNWSLLSSDAWRELLSPSDSGVWFSQLFVGGGADLPLSGLPSTVREAFLYVSEAFLDHVGVSDVPLQTYLEAIFGFGVSQTVLSSLGKFDAASSIYTALDKVQTLEGFESVFGSQNMEVVLAGIDLVSLFSGVILAFDELEF